MRNARKAIAVRPIGHLVVVAGLKGAGKSTFIDQFASGGLSPEIANQLPRTAPAWPNAHAEHAQYWLPRVARGLEGLILHYDLYRLHRHGRDDSAIRALALAHDLTIIDIRPKVSRLIKQFEARTTDEARQKLLAPTLPDAHRKAGEAIALRGKVIAHYATSGWPEKVYAAWDDLVASAGTPGFRQTVEIEPRGSADSPGWRVRDRN